MLEGGKTAFTVTLGRSLAAGEVIDAPLSVSGTGVTTADWTLAKESGAANTGVTLLGAGTATPVVRFSGAGAKVATLELTVTDDGPVDDGETFTVALGSAVAFNRRSRGTNVAGGADPHGTRNSFDVQEASAFADTYVSFSSGTYRVGEGDDLMPELVLSPPLSEDVTVMVETLDLGGARSGVDFEAGPWEVTVPAGTARHRFKIKTLVDDEAEQAEEVLLHIPPYGPFTQGVPQF